MLERKFLNLVGIEGVFAILIGSLMLILPKVTSLAIATVLAIVLVAYGIYKIINSIVERKYIRHVFLNIFLSVF